MTTRNLTHNTVGTGTLTARHPTLGNATASVTTTSSGGGSYTPGALQGVKTYTDPGTGTQFKYQVGLPINYDPALSWPMIVCLHGSGEYGTDGVLQTSVYTPSLNTIGWNTGAILIFLQAFSGMNGTQLQAYRQSCIDLPTNVIAAQYTGNVNKLSLTGYSLGGIITYETAFRFASKLAAIAVLSGHMQYTEITGATDEPSADTIYAASAAKNIPTWIYHGLNDGNVAVQLARNINSALIAASAPDEHYTEDPSGDHTQTYWQSIYNQQVAFWGWLASKQILQLSGQLDPTNTATGAGILNSIASQPPAMYDWARHYDGTGYSGNQDKQWRATRVYTGAPTYLDATKAGGQTNNHWPASTWGDGFGFADMMSLVQTPDATFGPVGWNEPCWEEMQYGNNDANESPSANHWMGTADPTLQFASIWLVVRRGQCSTPPFTMVGDPTSDWGKAWSNIQVDNIFTLANPIIPTGNPLTVTVTTDTGQLTHGANWTVILGHGTANAEYVTPSNVTSTTFQCTPSKSHAAGDSCSVYASQAAAKKWGPYAAYLGTGRSGLECSNGSNPPGNGLSYPTGNYFLGAGPTATTLGGQGGMSGSITPPAGGGNFVGPEMADGKLHTLAVLIEQLTDGGGQSWSALTYYDKVNGAANWTKMSRRQVCPMAAVTKFYEYNYTGLNYNQSRGTTLKRWYTHWAMWDAGTYPDPLGIKAYFNSVTPTAPVSVAISGTPTSSAVTLNVTIGVNQASLRAKIDGVWITGQDYTMKFSEGEENFRNYDTKTGPAVISMPLSGLALASGSHTVQVFGIAGNGTTIEATGASTTFTV